MSHPLTRNQLELLAQAEATALAASTLREHSELRWLEHLGLLSLDSESRFTITPQGRARLAGEAADSRFDT